MKIIVAVDANIILSALLGGKPSSILLETYLWSQDKDFEKAGYQKLLKTYDFIS